MMLTELLAADIDTLRQYALVFDAQLASALGTKWQQYGSRVCIPAPRTLTDGRYMLSADVLSEVHLGGYLHGMWVNSDHAAIAAGTEVMPWADAVAMIPASPEIG